MVPWSESWLGSLCWSKQLRGILCFTHQLLSPSTSTTTSLDLLRGVRWRQKCECLYAPWTVVETIVVYALSRFDLAFMCYYILILRYDVYLPYHLSQTDSVFTFNILSHHTSIPYVSSSFLVLLGFSNIFNLSVTSNICTHRNTTVECPVQTILWFEMFQKLYKRMDVY